MDINNDLQQINTFVKGMNTDVSDALMDSSQYRYAENVRLSTNEDENTGELRLIEGTKQFPYSRGDIKAMTSIRDMIIVITSDSKIWKKDVNKDKIFQLVFDPGNGEGFNVENLSLVTRYENSNDVKLYIADGLHNLMYLNLNDINSGIVQNMTNIVSVIDSPLDKPGVNISENNGQVPPVKLQYVYRMYEEGGAATTLSPLSSIIVLYDGDEGYRKTDTISNRAVDITIPAYAGGDFDKLQIFRIAYVQVGQDPSVNLIYDGDYIQTFTDKGTNVSASSFENILAMQQGAIVPSIIESKNDYLFAANVVYKQDSLDRYLDTEGDFRIYSSGDYDNGTTVREYNEQFEQGNIKQYNSTFWLNGQGQTGGDGDYLSWTLLKHNVYINDKNEKFENFDVNSGTSNQIQGQISSLRQGEVYRYGAIFYNNEGQKSSVKWLCDIMAPILPPYTVLSYGSQNICEVVQIGVKFTINQLPDGFVGVEIVRAPRQNTDKIRVVQGIAGFPYQLWERNNSTDPMISKNNICAPYLISTNRFMFPVSNDTTHSQYALSQADTDNSVLVFACPEYTYQADDVSNLLSDRQLDVQIAYNRRITVENVHLTDEILQPIGLTPIINLNNTNICQVQNYNDNNTSNYWRAQTDGDNGFVYDLIVSAYSTFDALNITGQATSNLIETHNVRNLSFYKIYPRGYFNDKYTGIKQIDNIAFTTSPESNTAIVNQQPNFENSSINIGGKQYINWSIPTLYHQKPELVKKQWTNDDDDWEYRLSQDIARLIGYHPVFTPIGSTGKYILIDLNEDIPFSDISSSDNFAMTVPVVNIMRRSPNPYSGTNTIQSSNYIQHGYYKEYTEGGNNDIDVFDGDCYPGIFIFNAQHAWYDASLITKEGQYFNPVRQSCVYIVPLESDIDLSATYGDLYNRSAASYYIQDKTDVVDGYRQANDAYMYNTAYGYEPNSLQYSTISYSTVSDNTYDCRIHYSDPKTNGEQIDNWLVFKQNNYLDVDTRYGKITNMRLFKDKLLFWQEHATGILSVNERTVLNDVDGHDIIVGSGGVLSRYDYISTIYGMKPQQYEAEIQSNYTQYWWDGYNKEILAYTGGMELIPLTKTKGCTNYINERTESTHPTLAFDIKYNEVLAQVVSNETLVYSEQIQAFSSVYTFTPLYRTIVQNDLYLSSNDSIYLWNTQNVQNYAQLFNEPIYPKVRVVVNKNNIYTKTFDNLTFGGRMYKGSLPTIVNWPMQRGNGMYVKDEHLNSPMHHLIFTFETPLKQKSAVRGDKATSVDEYDYRLAIPRNGSHDSDIEYGNRMRGKTMQCEIASDYNSTDFSLQYIITKFRMSWS